jgi:CRP/FNR family cyclic AMP-dependent transcriptional regulator
MRGQDKYLEQLGRVPLFAACSQKDLRSIARAGDEIRVPAGQTLCEEGRPGREFFLILDGKASVRPGNSKKSIASLGPGQYFGEMALLDRGPRSATVVADTDMDLLVLGQREFHGVVDEVPTLAHKLLATMAGRLRDADTRSTTH